MARVTMPLTTGWKFQADPFGIGDSQLWKNGIPDAIDVTVPHTWNVMNEYEEFRGNGWYQYTFVTDESWSNQCVRVQFQGVYRTAAVWLNGEELHVDQASGYLPFEVELTPSLKLGEENVLVVCANNEQTTDALPYRNSFDWADDGGIFREVTLIRSGNPAIEYIALQAKPDIHQQLAATGTVTSSLYFYHHSEQSIDVLVTVRDAQDGSLVFEERYHQLRIENNSLTLPPMKLERIKLWHFDRPALYDVSFSVLTNGQASDQVTIRTGFKKVSTAGNTLLLNGEPVRLMGVEWMPGSHPEHGMADTEDTINHMLTLMKEANIVFTRFHWQQGEQLLKWCDQHGILVQEEVPYWQQPFEANEQFTEAAKRHVKSMIRWHQHHPSIFSWGVGNELDGQSDGTKNYVQNLRAYVKELDDTRLCNYTSNTFHLGESSDATGYGDSLMWNDYIGTWHEGAIREEVIANAKQHYPNHPLFVVEYGLCEPAFEGGDERRIQILEEQTACYAESEHIAGAIFFSLNDYRTQMGEDGKGKLRQRVHGVTDLYGQVKPSYWHLREVSSPITVQLQSFDSASIHVEISCKAQLPSYTAENYQLAIELVAGDGNIVVGDQAALPKLSPNESTVISIPCNTDDAPLLKLKVLRGTGFSVIDRVYELEGLEY